MRPRVFPAEDVTDLITSRRKASEASMRPRVFPAEDTAAAGEYYLVTISLQ